ncbi:MAG: hypothetical protein HN352_13760 [Bacteroidetes bacterium]|jgi:hypothetical protein|nr:hypothetical protein [Bacteroidota bacterium]MBT3748818.1 hypothetical protein [Bacteroidota bacterium]MBT4408551.1 hypothetical protein [Bacteroidota bacterium]MBT5424981.1 hypothetical protein [Bacteroidota bacterium]MBT7466177.1 hypothetical protein [Bacteroidota bacterium]
MERRKFIRNTGLALSGLAMSPRLIANSTTDYKLPDNWFWSHGSSRISVENWKILFDRLSRAGFNGMLSNGNHQFYTDLAPLCKEFGIQLHAWQWTVNRGGYAKEHPEWYSVSRKGDSVIDKPPYVGYYKWLCPSNEEVRKVIADDYANLTSIPGLSGVHLDYVRYCDVYLPTGLQPKYDLVQDHEMPEYDFCYCENCRSKFEGIHGYDPLDKDDPVADEAWHNFRLDQVVELVHGIVDAVHAKNSIITGAVFPTPEMSRRMVRQDWARFNLDAYQPMLYHDAYLEDTHWIARGIGEARAELGPDIPIYAGMLFGRNFDPKLLVETYKEVRDAGGNGISIFTGRSLSDEQLKAFGKI